MSSEVPQLEVLLACFEGHKWAARVHHPRSGQVKADGAQIWGNWFVASNAGRHARNA